MYSVRRRSRDTRGSGYGFGEAEGEALDSAAFSFSFFLGKGRSAKGCESKKRYNYFFHGILFKVMQDRLQMKEEV